MERDIPKEDRLKMKTKAEENELKSRKSSKKQAKAKELKAPTGKN